MMFNRPKVLLYLLLLSLFVSCNNSKNSKSEFNAVPTDTIASKQVISPVFMYGIQSDSFNLVTGNIKRNGFLSEILLKHGVSMQVIDQALKNSRSVFDVRKIRSGNNYILFCDKDSSARARYLVYEHDPSTCYVFSFNDSLNITPFRKAIKSEIKYASGSIETSLWNAMINGGLHQSLVNELSEVFAWTVDFFGLQKGDNFKVIYEEFFIDGKSLGVGRIYGAQFTWSDKTLSLIHIS